MEFRRPLPPWWMSPIQRDRMFPQATLGYARKVIVESEKNHPVKFALSLKPNGRPDNCGPT